MQNVGRTQTEMTALAARLGALGDGAWPKKHGLPSDHHRNGKYYSEERALVHRFHGIDGDQVDLDTFSAAQDHLVRLGLNADCVRARQAIIRSRKTSEFPIGEQTEEDALFDAGLDDETAAARAAFLAGRGMNDPAAEDPNARCAAAASVGQLDQKDNGDQTEALSFNDQRCLKALALANRGKTQKEIADYFGRKERSVRDWLKRARQLQLAKLRSVTPESVLADTHDRYASMMVRLTDQHETACAKNDDRLALEISREIRQWEQHHLKVLADIKFFRGYEHSATACERVNADVRNIAFGL